MFDRWGRFTYRRRRLIVGGWVAILVLGFGAGGAVFDRLSTEEQGNPRLESVRAHERVAELTGAGDQVAAVVEAPSDGPATKAAVTAAANDLRRLDGVAQVADPYTMGSPGLVAEEGDAVLVAVTLKDGLDAGVEDSTVDAVEARLRAIDVGHVKVGGSALMGREWVEQSERDLQKAESLALPVALVVMVVLFGGVLAAGIPILIAIVSVAASFLLLLGVTVLADVSTYAVNVATMFGLGLGIDYGLLMVGRFREERAAGLSVPDAVERTVATAGRTIAFSALTVAVALSGLFAFDEPVLRSLAVGGVGVVVFAMSAGLTLLPALLGAWGRRIRPVRQAADNDGGVFLRLGRFVQRRAVPVTVVVTGGLVVLASPFLGVQFTNMDARSLPRSSETRAVSQTLAERFPARQAEPVTAVVEAPPGSPDVVRLTAAMESLSGAAAASVRPGTSEATVIDVVPDDGGRGGAGEGLVREIRALDSRAEFGVTGDAAFFTDLKQSIADGLPLAIAIIVLATFVLLFLMTGSLVIPAKAVVMNVISLGATFGALVWVFQDGHFAGWLGFDPIGGVNLVIPVLVFVFAFGLSMDYEVFLLSRIKEIHDEIGDNDEAVVQGLQRTGKIITSAALLIVVVFAGFVTGEMLMIKQLGLGLAVAVVVDATIVRSLLVPATMTLMGEWNWWAPAPLRRVYDRFGLRETASTVRTPGAAGDVELEPIAA